jgi:hypothetical protein
METKVSYYCRRCKKWYPATVADPENVIGYCPADNQPMILNKSIEIVKKELCLTTNDIGDKAVIIRPIN